MKHGVKRTLALMALLATLVCALPIAPAYARPCVLPECKCEDCECEEWCGYHPYGCGGERTDGKTDYTADKKVGHFKGKGGTVYDSASESGKQLARLTGDRTLYLDMNTLSKGWVMVYYNGGDNCGWAKYSQIR